MKRFQRFLLLLLSSLIIIQMCCAGKKSGSGEVHALILAGDNYGLNYFLLKDALELDGWHIFTAGLSDTIHPCPAVRKLINIPPLTPDIVLKEDTAVPAYDCIIIPPGSGSYFPVPDAFGDLMKSPLALGLIREAAETGKIIYATCAGVRVLAAADIIRGRRLVGSPRFREEYEKAGARFLGNDHPPETDGNIVTSARGLYYNQMNSMAIVTALENQTQLNQSSVWKKVVIQSSDIAVSDSSIAWARTFGSTEADGAAALCRTMDGGVVVTGYTFSTKGKDADCLVLKISAGGELEWTSLYGGPGNDYGFGCTAIEEGYLITGYTVSAETGSRDVLLVKLDELGQEIGTRTYGGKGLDVGTSVIETGDGYTICGYTRSPDGEGEENIFLLHTDRNGEERWYRTYGGDRSEIPNRIYPAENGGYLISATTGSFGRGNNDFYLIRTDSEGTMLWSKTHGTNEKTGHGFDWCTNGIITPDGGLVLVGYTDSRDIMDMHMTEMDAAGQPIWSHSYGNHPFYDYGTAVARMTGDRLLLCGVTKSMDNNNDIMLIETDSEGRPVKKTIIPLRGFDWISDITMTSNGEWIAAGQTNSAGAGSFDMLVMKLAPENPAIPDK